MRFHVGQVVPFIKIDFVSLMGNRYENGSGFYSPLGDKLIKIDVYMLTCVEHVKVGLGFDEATVEPKYDGFVFRDEKGNIWNNQVPTASYGQIDDSANWLVDNDRVLGQSPVTLVYGFYYMDVALQQIASLGLNRKPVEMHQEFFNKVKFAIEQASHREVLIRDWVVTKLDGSKENTGVKRAGFIEQFPDCANKPPQVDLKSWISPHSSSGILAMNYSEGCMFYGYRMTNLIEITYLTSCEDEENSWFTNQTEYYKLTDLGIALKAFEERKNKPEQESSFARPLEDILEKVP